MRDKKLEFFICLSMSVMMKENIHNRCDELISHSGQLSKHENNI